MGRPRARRDHVAAEVLLAKGRLTQAFEVLHAAVFAYPDDADLDKLYRKFYPAW